MHKRTLKHPLGQSGGSDWASKESNPMETKLKNGLCLRLRSHSDTAHRHPHTTRQQYSTPHYTIWRLLALTLRIVNHTLPAPPQHVSSRILHFSFKRWKCHIGRPRDFVHFKDREWRWEGILWPVTLVQDTNARRVIALHESIHIHTSSEMR